MLPGTTDKLTALALKVKLIYFSELAHWFPTCGLQTSGMLWGYWKMSVKSYAHQASCVVSIKRYLISIFIPKRTWEYLAKGISNSFSALAFLFQGRFYFYLKPTSLLLPSPYPRSSNTNMDSGQDGISQCSLIRERTRQHRSADESQQSSLLCPWHELWPTWGSSAQTGSGLHPFISGHKARIFLFLSFPRLFWTFNTISDSSLASPSAF